MQYFTDIRIKLYRFIDTSSVHCDHVSCVCLATANSSSARAADHQAGCPKFDPRFGWLRCVWLNMLSAYISSIVTCKEPVGRGRDTQERG